MRFIVIVFFLLVIVIPTYGANAVKAKESDKTVEVSNSEKPKKTEKSEKTTEAGKGEKSEKTEESEKTVKVGNFSLPATQQPGPLVGFGEHVIEKGEVQIYLYSDAFIGDRNYNTDIIPAYVYGITDTFAFRFNVPYAPANKYENSKSSGIEDLFIEFEYAYYSKEHKYSSDQATILAGVTVPTGSSTKDPRTGFGSPSFMIGLTYNHTEVNWFFFGATGIVLTTEHDFFRAGHQFLYQAGIGRDICTPPGWIYAWMVEFIGEYRWRDIIDGFEDPDTGGNVISIVPSLWLSSERLILQFGIGTPIVQHLFGNQRKEYASFYLNLGLTF